jgi:hypothetical protein
VDQSFLCATSLRRVPPVKNGWESFLSIVGRGAQSTTRDRKDSAFFRLQHDAGKGFSTQAAPLLFSVDSQFLPNKMKRGVERAKADYRQARFCRFFAAGNGLRGNGACRRLPIFDGERLDGIQLSRMWETIESPGSSQESAGEMSYMRRHLSAR